LGTGSTFVTPNAISNNMQEIKNWNLDPTIGALQGFFESSYGGIKKANVILTYIDEIEFENEATRNQYKGEARFIRAFYYFHLVRLFGEVPVYTTEIDPDASSNTPASSVQEVYNQIIEDLNFAVANVPAFKIPGRADKTAAEAQLAKVYLHLASSKEYGSPRYEWVADQNQMYANAAQAAKNVLNSATFDLDASVFDTFPDNDRESNEKLFVWSVDVDGLEVGRTSLQTFFMPYTFYSQFYTDEPGTDNIIGYWGGWASMSYDHDDYLSHDTNDQRLDLFIKTIYSDPNGGNPADQGDIHYNLKYASETGAFYTGAATPFFLRMSDIALVYAEAVGPTGEGYNQINRIRNRANIGDLTPGLSRAAFIEAVWQERQWELVMEGYALFDLRRTHRVDEYVGRDVDYSYFFPIPQREVDLNQGIETDSEKKTLN